MIKNTNYLIENNPKYKQITDYKPSGNFIYSKESKDLLSNKTNKLLE